MLKMVIKVAAFVMQNMIFGSKGCYFVCYYTVLLYCRIENKVCLLWKI